MKTLTRIGSFLLIVAIALVLIATQRAYSPVYGSIETQTIHPNNWYESNPLILPPQEIRISFSTTNQKRISVYVLDPTAFQTWNQTHELKPTIAIENVSSHVGTYDIPRRDVYTIVVHNLDTQATSTEVGLTAFGFETDLSIAASTMAAMGIALIIIQKLRKPKPHSQRICQP